MGTSPARFATVQFNINTVVHCHVSKVDGDMLTFQPIASENPSVGYEPFVLHIEDTRIKRIDPVMELEPH